MQYKPSKWVSGYKHGPAASYTQITRMGLFLNVATSKFEPLDSTWDNLHSGGMFVSGTNKIYFRDETNKDIYINSPADNQITIGATGGIGINQDALATGSGYTSLRIGGNANFLADTAIGASALMILSHNAQYDSDNSWEYISTDEATQYTQRNGGHEFKTAVSGSAGADITFLNQMTITAAGEITAPLQPAFLARPAADQTDFAVGSAVTVVFGTEEFDQGGDFASNTFTAPVDGKYQFSAGIRIDNIDTAATYYQIRLTVSGHTYIRAITYPSVYASDPGYWTLPIISILVDMDASDTAYVAVAQVGGSAQSDVSTDSWFSGFLAC